MNALQAPPVVVLQGEPPVFDPQVLAAMFDGELQVMRSLLHTFIGSMDEHLREFQQAAAAQDLARAGAAAHRVKGAAGMSGALALGQCAACLEAAARAADWPAAAWPELRAQWDRLRADPLFCAALADGKED